MIVVADTSVLLNLCCVKQGSLLDQLFQEVIVPPEVAAEFLRLVTPTTRFANLTLPAGIKQQLPGALPPPIRSAIGLDPGDPAALALPVEICADWMLIDERRGYDAPFSLGFEPWGFSGSCCAQKRLV